MILTENGGRIMATDFHPPWIFNQLLFGIGIHHCQKNKKKGSPTAILPGRRHWRSGGIGDWGRLGIGLELG